MKYSALIQKCKDGGWRNAWGNNFPHLVLSCCHPVLMVLFCWEQACNLFFAILSYLVCLSCLVLLFSITPSCTWGLKVKVCVLLLIDLCVLCVFCLYYLYILCLCVHRQAEGKSGCKALNQIPTSSYRMIAIKLELWTQEKNIRIWGIAYEVFVYSSKILIQKIKWKINESTHFKVLFHCALSQWRLKRNFQKKSFFQLVNLMRKCEILTFFHQFHIIRFSSAEN